MSLQHLGRVIAYIKSASRALNVWTCASTIRKKNLWPGCRCHSRSWQVCSSRHKVKDLPWFPIRSWVDLPHVCSTSNCLAFHFRDCQICFCLPLTLSNSGSSIFLIPDTFQPRRWALSSRCCPASNYFPLNSNTPSLKLSLTGKVQVYLHRDALSSPHSTKYLSGVTEYLEDLVTFIDTPQLNSLYTTFSNQIDFNCPRLAQFINCTPKLRALDEAHVQFDDVSANVTLRSRTSESRFEDLLINIPCCELDWQLSSIQQVCNFPLPPTSMEEDLYIEHQYSELVFQNDTIDLENLIEHPMVATLTSIYRGEKSLPFQGVCTRYCGRSARACRRQINKIIAQPAEYFHGGAWAIGTFPGKPWAVLYRAATLRSPYRHF